MQKIFLIGAMALLAACSDKAATPAPDKAPPIAGSAATAATPPEQAPQAPSPDQVKKLRVDGVGPIRFGMTLLEAEQAVGAKAQLPTPVDPACSMVRFAALSKLRFMVENGVITRADAEPGVENATGVDFGATLAQIRASHPNAIVTAHKYDANAHYVTFPSADGRAAIILEEIGGKVTKIRAGLQPAVAYVETCG